MVSALKKQQEDKNLFTTFRVGDRENGDLIFVSGDVNRNDLLRSIRNPASRDKVINNMIKLNGSDLSLQVIHYLDMMGGYAIIVREKLGQKSPDMLAAVPKKIKKERKS
ncbi:MAG: hypothetical protein AABX38_00890 [Candidatus Micrarchaeota archaeon]